MKTKKNLLLLLTVFALSIFSGCGGKSINTSTQSSKHEWKVVSSITNQLKVTIAGFVDEKYGIVVGRDGTTHFTNKGFKKLQNGSNPQKGCLFGLCILNNKVTYACGNGSTVVKTLDGGANWQAVSDFGGSEPSQARYLSFVDENSGWIAMPQNISNTYQLASTKNGGKTWVGINLPKDMNRIITINLINSNDGYILDELNNLYITHDGGKSFSKQKLNINDMFDFSSMTFLPYSQQVALRFIDEKNVVIAYKGKNKKLKIAQSNDGGKTWLDQPVEDVNAGAVYISPDGKIISLVQNDGFYSELNPHNNVRILEFK